MTVLCVCRQTAVDNTQHKHNEKDTEQAQGDNARAQSYTAVNDFHVNSPHFLSTSFFSDVLLFYYVLYCVFFSFLLFQHLASVSHNPLATV